MRAGPGWKLKTNEALVAQALTSSNFLQESGTPQAASVASVASMCQGDTRMSEEHRSCVGDTPGCPYELDHVFPHTLTRADTLRKTSRKLAYFLIFNCWISFAHAA
jgi:hypothetical protein